MFAFNRPPRRIHVAVISARRLHSFNGITANCNGKAFEYLTRRSLSSRSPPILFSSTVKLFSTISANRYIQEQHHETRVQSQDIPSFEKQTTEVYQVLRTGEPRQILSTLADPRNGDAVGSLPDTVFVSTLLQLTPEYFVAPYIDILSQVPNGNLLTKGINSVRNALWEFLRPLDQILMTRLAAGNSLGLAEYKHLLRITASLGNREYAERYWDMMIKERIEPDLQCYNYLLHASVWERAHFGPEKYRLHFTRYYYLQRSFEDRPKHRGFGTRLRSVRLKVQGIIKEMQSVGLEPDEETYINLLLAHARVGNSVGMAETLKTVWMVNIDDPASLEQVDGTRPLPRSSPIYPTRKLLFAVAHAYGCLFKFAEALLTVNHISKQYGIEITNDVWAELLERGFVASRPRGGRYAHHYKDRISDQALVVLKKRLQLNGSPHDMILFRKFAATMTHRKQHYHLPGLMNEAYALFQRTRQRRDHALKVLAHQLGISLDIHSNKIFASTTKADLRRQCYRPQVWRAFQKYEVLRLLTQQQQIIMEKIAKVSVSHAHLNYRTDVEWHWRRLPKFIGEWNDFLPEAFRVPVNTSYSMIEFVGRTNMFDQNIRSHDYDPVRRSSKGELVAGVGTQLQVRHEVLWKHIEDWLGDLAGLEPFRWFFTHRLRFKEDSELAKFRGDRGLDDPISMNEYLSGWRNENILDDGKVIKYTFGVISEKGLDPRDGLTRQSSMNTNAHSHYVTMLPVAHVHELMA